MKMRRMWVYVDAQDVEVGDEVQCDSGRSWLVTRCATVQDTTLVECEAGPVLRHRRLQRVLVNIAPTVIELRERIKDLEPSPDSNDMRVRPW